MIRGPIIPILRDMLYVAKKTGAVRAEGQVQYFYLSVSIVAWQLPL